MIAKGRGRGAKGERNIKAKLTREQVQSIREDGRTQVLIAKAYGVAQPTICRIKMGTGWKETA